MRSTGAPAAESDRVHEHSHHEDEDDRGQHQAHIGEVTTALQQLPEADAELWNAAMISAAMSDRQANAQPCLRPAR